MNRLWVTNTISFKRNMLTCVSAICNPNLNILLHGNEYLSEEQNINVFMDVHNFIAKSKCYFVVVFCL